MYYKGFHVVPVSQVFWSKGNWWQFVAIRWVGWGHEQ